MNTRYEAAPRATAAGVTTAAILVVILAMGASTLTTAAAQMTAGQSQVQVAQSAPAHKG